MPKFKVPGVKTGPHREQRWKTRLYQVCPFHASALKTGPATGGPKFEHKNKEKTL